MAAWSCLPPEIKRHIVKKLDFMGRHALRNTCHLEREIVDSTICKLPRVRFGYKEGKCLIVIYTGIDQFLRFEIEECDEGVVVYKLENTYNRDHEVKTIRTEHLPKKETCMMIGFEIFETFLTNQSINIRVLELDIPKILETEQEFHQFFDLFLRFYSFTTHKVQEISMTRNTNQYLANLSIQHFMKEGIKSFRNVSLVVSRDNLVPMVAHDYRQDVIGQCVITDTKLVMENTMANMLVMFGNDCNQVKVDVDERKPQMCSFRNPHHKLQENKVVINPGAGRWTWLGTSKCGEVIHSTSYCQTKHFSEFFKIEKCGLGDFCKQCADPFDYWYTQNLPRRIYFEPFWDGIIDRDMQNGRNPDIEMAELRIKMGKYEKEKERIQKIVNSKKEKIRVSSWGFGPKKAKPIVMGYEKIDSECEKPIEIEPSPMEDSEVILNATVTQESTVTRNTKTTTKSIIKYLAIFFVFPISIAIFSYFCFYGY